jgi:hypothetical protein
MNVPNLLEPSTKTYRNSPAWFESVVDAYFFIAKFAIKLACELVTARIRQVLSIKPNF